MSLAERGISEPTVNISGLLSGQRPRLEGASQVRLGDYAAEIVNSGFPALRGNPERLCRAELDGYIDRIIDHDFDDLGLRIRDRGSLRRWMTAYAAATSTSALFATIRDAATPGEPDKPARSTTISYRAALEQLWMIEEIPAWLPTRNRLTLGCLTGAPTRGSSPRGAATRHRRRSTSRGCRRRAEHPPRRHPSRGTVRIAADAVGACLCPSQRGPRGALANQRRRTRDRSHP